MREKPGENALKLNKAARDAAGFGRYPEAYGDTEAQTISVMHKTEQTLARRGYGLGDVVKLTVFLVGVPEKQGRLDIEGFTRGYIRFFGTAAQPSLVARSTVPVTALGTKLRRPILGR